MRSPRHLPPIDVPLSLSLSLLPYVCVCVSLLPACRGQVVEYDDPVVLLDNPESSFHQLVSQMGTDGVSRLKDLALTLRAAAGPSPSASAKGGGHTQSTPRTSTPSTVASSLDHHDPHHPSPLFPLVSGGTAMATLTPTPHTADDESALGGFDDFVGTLSMAGSHEDGSEEDLESFPSEAFDEFVGPPPEPPMLTLQEALEHARRVSTAAMLDPMHAWW